MPRAKGKKKKDKAIDIGAFERFRAACLQVANAYGVYKEAEDAASWALIKRLEGSQAAAKFLIIDYIRHTLGRNKDENKLVRAALRRPIPIKDDYDEEDDAPPSPGVVLESNDSGVKPTALYYIANTLKFSLYERACFFLYYCENLPEEYIGNYLGTNANHVRSTLGVINAIISGDQKLKEDLKSYLE